jgi:UDP-N-acetylglucosamine 2-epimerase (non-hydrolysing)
MKILIVVGTRPQLIKLASLVKAFDDFKLEYGLVHTGQHYDFEMDHLFFEELKLPEPLANLKVGSGLHGWQTGNMLIKLEEAYLRFKPLLVIVPGDTNSALAGGLAAVKLCIHVAHLEAGLRSKTPFMAEEINRTLLDHLSQLLFAPTKTAYDNLLREGIHDRLISFTGDVMADNIVLLRDKLEKVALPLGLERKSYVYVTLHRSENVEDPKRLRMIVQTLTEIPRMHGLKVIFPIHPHTRKKLQELGLYNKLNASDQVCLLKPIGYFESLKLAKDAVVVLTDSGGLQKESFILQTPVITMRENTEWIETVQCGWNIIANVDPERINNGVKKFMELKPKPVDAMRFYGNGKAAIRIARKAREFLQRMSS